MLLIEVLLVTVLTELWKYQPLVIKYQLLSVSVLLLALLFCVFLLLLFLKWCVDKI